ncbi:hypothetical protein T07_9819, partial [Trichinella nelsoni]
MVSVMPWRVWDKATSGQKLQGAARPMQLGDGGRWRPAAGDIVHLQLGRWKAKFLPTFLPGYL